MKKLLAISLLLNAVLLTEHFLQRDLSVARADQCAKENGDANADNMLDIGDVIYILRYLFIGDKQPAPFCTGPCVNQSPLPATGQTICYSDESTAIDCASTEYPGQDGYYRAGCTNEGRFIDHGDGTVTDTCIGLMWQKDTADIDGSGDIGDGDMVLWKDALQYCENLEFAGYTDWRLPNVRELQSIADYQRSNPAIDPVFGAVSNWYWSSTTFPLYPGHAWSVGFVLGRVINDRYKPEEPYYARAVRNAQ